MQTTHGKPEPKIIAIKAAAGALKQSPASPNSVPALREEVRLQGALLRALCDHLGFDPGDITPAG